MIRVKMHSIVVNDQAKAHKFYTEKLGFIVKKDIPMGEYSWLTVGHADDEVELLLEPDALDSARIFYADLYEKGIPQSALSVDDIEDEYVKLTAAGVKFKSPPQEMEGAKYATFDDTCGNYIQLYQEL
ncbi:MAG: VOC family protein [Kordiimonadaceae bacterium]|jgi:predicted enzyme related to lactoylglutathione lyase|nr:VOC family protein [Kordiimonadaceae bacterium]